MPSRNHKPHRTCIGCNRRDAQDTMLRLVVRDGAVLIDATRRLHGRGGYLHRQRNCLDGLVRSKLKVFRSFKHPLPLDERRNIADRITKLIQDAAGPYTAAGIK